MKICDIIETFSPLGGGIRTYITEKQKYIREKGIDHHVLIIPGAFDGVRVMGRLKTVTVKSIPIPGCKPYRFISNLEKVYRILDMEHPDLIELASAYTIPYAIFKYRTKRPVVMFGFYHTDYPKAYVENYLKNFIGLGLAKYARKAAELYATSIYNRMDAVLTASVILEQRLKEMGILQTHRITMGVDTDLFHPSKRDFCFRANLGCGPSDVLMVYTGRLDSEKRIDIILEAFHRVSAGFPGHLLVVGEGPYKSLVLDYTSKNSKIHFLPYQHNRETLAMILASSDIYVTAGPYETFGLSVAEAQACGLATIGVRAGALIERIPDSVGILVSCDSIEAMAAGMLDISCNGFREKGKVARIWVEKTLSWTKTFDKIFSLYREYTQSL